MRQGDFILAAGRVRSKRKKTRENPPHPKHTTKSTAAPRLRPTRDGMRGNTSHVVYPGFVEIDLVQLSQSVKTTNVTRTHTDRLIK